MKKNQSETLQFLQQWHAGDPKGLDLLLEHNLPYIRNKVRQKLSPLLRQKNETCDYVQDIVMQFLSYAPRFVVADAAHFRALLIRIIENALHDTYDRFTAQRREAARERPLPSDTVLNLTAREAGPATPSKSAQRHEQEAFVRFGMELLDEKEREVLVLREWQRETFVGIGRQLNLSTDAARMRYNRALEKLEDKIWNLRRGKLDQALALADLKEAL